MTAIFFCPKDAIGQATVLLAGNSAHHIAKVLRMKAGMTITLFDGEGGKYDGFIKEVSHKHNKILIEILSKESINPHPSPNIILCQAIIKGLRFDWIIEKATELGVDAIIPLLTSQTKVHLKDTMPNKLQRWKQIAINASEQCKRFSVPKILPPMVFTEAAENKSLKSFALLLWEGENKVLLKNILPAIPPKELWVFVGPEGGFSKEEIDLAVKLGIPTASLGALTLRADTAPIAALAVLRHLYPWQTNQGIL